MIYVFAYFWQCWVFVAEHSLSLVVLSRAYSLVAICGLIVAVASLVGEYGF